MTCVPVSRLSSSWGDSQTDERTASAPLPRSSPSWWVLRTTPRSQPSSENVPRLTTPGFDPVRLQGRRARLNKMFTMAAAVRRGCHGLLRTGIHVAGHLDRRISGQAAIGVGIRPGAKRLPNMCGSSRIPRSAVAQKTRQLAWLGSLGPARRRPVYPVVPIVGRLGIIPAHPSARPCASPPCTQTSALSGGHSPSATARGTPTPPSPPRYLLAIPCGRAGPEAKAVLKSRLNRVSNSSLECCTFRM